MKVGSLFSGIGGLELGLERAGMTTRWQVEWDDWCQQILQKHWPDIPRYKDIHNVNPDELEPVDLICGGFPCQPVSLAGARKAQDDDRWLWPEYFRIVRQIRPRYVLVENVPGLASAGMGDVLGDLASIGYDCEWESIPAAAVGAPHLRYRIFIVAYPHRERGRQTTVFGTERQDTSVVGNDGSKGYVAHAGSGRQREGPHEPSHDETSTTASRRDGAVGTIRGTVSRVTTGSGDSLRDTETALADPKDSDRRSDSHNQTSIQSNGFIPRRTGGANESRTDWWTVEPDVGRVADGVPSRVDRLRGLGNAVVPQVAEYVGRLIMEHSRL